MEVVSGPHDSGTTKCVSFHEIQSAPLAFRSRTDRSLSQFMHGVHSSYVTLLLRVQILELYLCHTW